MSEITNIRRLQSEEIEALKTLIDFCNKNELTYFLRGGSVLGAVKYSGMIPWDDDIDVILPRRDYNKMIKIIPSEWENFIFAHYSRRAEINCYFARLYLKEDRRNELNLPKNNAFGLVLLDILPIDGAPQNRISFICLKLRINFLRLLASVHTLDHKETVVKRKGIKKIIPELLNKLHVHKLYRQIDIYHKLEGIYSCYSYDTASLVGVFSGSKADKEVFPKKWLGNGAAHKFEEMTVQIPEQYDSYLKLLFDEDYMLKEPAENARKPKHFEGEL